MVFLLDEYIGGEICDCGIFVGRWRGQITSRSGNEKKEVSLPMVCLLLHICIYIHSICKFISSIICFFFKKWRMTWAGYQVHCQG